MITFVLPHTIYFNSAKHCIESVRNVYTDYPIDLYLDPSDTRAADYRKLCQDYNCNFIIGTRTQGYINKNDSIETNLPKMLESHFRLYNSCKLYESEWVLILEDDVFLKKEITRFPAADCGKNREDVGFLGGGSIFKRDAYIKIYENVKETGLTELIKQNHLFSWAGDVLKKHLFTVHGYTNEKWVELAEPGYWDDTDYSVFHGYKALHKLG